MEDIMEPLLGDPTLDILDGSRVVEVTALWGGSVLSVHQLSRTETPRTKLSTWATLVAGVGLVGLGVLSALFGLLGLAALLWLGGLGLWVYAGLRRKEERLPAGIYLGASPEVDIPLASKAIASPQFPLVLGRDGEHVLHFTEEMAGQITIKEQHRNLSDLIRSGQAVPRDEGYAYVIPADARITIEIDPITLVIRSLPPARRPASRSPLGEGVARFTGISSVAHALVLLLALALPPSSRALSLDQFNTVSTVVKVEPPILPFGYGGQDRLDGQGLPQGVEEGWAGERARTPRADARRGRFTVNGPRENPDPRLAQWLAEEWSRHLTTGWFDPSIGRHVASIFSRESAFGRDAEDALGRLVGNPSGEAYGVGGLGLIGYGRGAGCGGHDPSGCAGESIGVGLLGTLGKGSGGGYGAGAARGVGGLSGRRAKLCDDEDMPCIVNGAIAVRGGLDREIIRRVIRQHKNEIRYCYQKELQSQEDLAGRVVVKFAITETGAVISSMIVESSLGNSSVESCIAQAARRWLFPKPHGGGLVQVNYPFVFNAPSR
jgi:TonB family protein